MHILITGASGMIGRKLASRLIADGQLRSQSIESLHLVDIVEPEPAPPPSDDCAIATTSEMADLAEPGVADRLASALANRASGTANDSAADADRAVVFHLAGVVSGEAEVDFDKGMQVNLDATMRLFEALRRIECSPRVVFTSSIAVFGAPFPDPIPDDFHLTPLTSYGTQKLAGEALLADYSRRGFFDGIGIRLPTISVRPGAPNAAASGFFSGIIREPLNGERAVLPVSRDVVHTHASPRRAIDYLVRAAQLDGGDVGPRRNITMPGVAVTVGDQIEALGRIAGPGAVNLISDVTDNAVETIVAGWPTRFAADRAESLGFVPEGSYDEIIQAYIDDDLGHLDER